MFQIRSDIDLVMQELELYEIDFRTYATETNLANRGFDFAEVLVIQFTYQLPEKQFRAFK